MEQLPYEFERCRRYGYPLSLIMCDIDHFKLINDEKGHACGDDVLQQFMARIQKSLRGHSDWIARYGGEEFLLVLPQTGLSKGMAAAEKVRGFIAETPFATCAGEAWVTASFGVSATASAGPDLDLTVDGLINVADRCLYASKQNGRNRTTGMEIPGSPSPGFNA
jgi:diguanylate cyclase (GGDEF)-like protein